jgi:hypothetical protein
MAPRPDLQVLLVSVLGSSTVYFQPPADIVMEYPCIVYARDYRRVFHANNAPYRHKKRYQVTVIDEHPDSDIPDRVAELPMCSYETFFAADDLNHDVFNLYF